VTNRRELPVISTVSLASTAPRHGRLPRRSHRVEFYGPDVIGKTTLALHVRRRRELGGVWRVRPNGRAALDLG